MTFRSDWFYPGEVSNFPQFGIYIQSVRCEREPISSPVLWGCASSQFALRYEQLLIEPESNQFPVWNIVADGFRAVVANEFECLTLAMRVGYVLASYFDGKCYAGSGE